MPKIIKWVSYDEVDANGYEETDIIDNAPKQPGYRRCTLRWPQYRTYIEPASLAYADAIRDAVVAANMRIGGDGHQRHGIPLFDDGCAVTMTYRHWGDFMAAVWSDVDQTDYNYLDFYMDCYVRPPATEP